MIKKLRARWEIDPTQDLHIMMDKARKDSKLLVIFGSYFKIEPNQENKFTIYKYTPDLLFEHHTAEEICVCDTYEEAEVYIKLIED